MGGLELSAFVYVYNLLDQREARSVFSDTGSPTYTTYPRPTDIFYNPDRVGTYNDLYSRPEWYIEPREVQLGITIGF